MALIPGKGKGVIVDSQETEIVILTLIKYALIFRLSGATVLMLKKHVRMSYRKS